MLPDDPLAFASPQQPPQEISSLPVDPPQLVPPESPVFSLWDVLAIVLFAFVSLNVFALLAYGLAHSMARFHALKITDMLSSTAMIIPVQTVWSFAVIGFAASLIRSKYRVRFFEAIRWNWPDGQRILWALAGGFGLVFVITEVANVLTPWRPTSLPMDKYFEGRLSAYLLAFFGTLVAPLTEEIFFRGLLYPVLARDTERVLRYTSDSAAKRAQIATSIAVLVTAFLFTLLHGAQLAHSWAALTPIFLVGLVLTIVRALRKSVGMTVLIHAGYNGTIFLATMIATRGFSR